MKTPHMIEVRPIRTKADLNAASRRIDEIISMIDAGNETQLITDELDVISTLVEAYETEHFPLENVDPIEAIKFMMEQHGMNRAALGDLLGNRSRATEILNRKRRLSADMMRTIHAKLHIPFDVLIQPYGLSPKRPKVLAR